MNSQGLRMCTKYFNAYRGIHTTRTRLDGARLKELQRQFQVANDLPVYLKRGPIDKLLFSFVCVAVAVGLADSLHFIYTLVYPKPK